VASQVACSKYHVKVKRKNNRLQKTMFNRAFINCSVIKLLNVGLIVKLRYDRVLNPNMNNIQFLASLK